MTELFLSDFFTVFLKCVSFVCEVCVSCTLEASNLIVTYYLYVNDYLGCQQPMIIECFLLAPEFFGTSLLLCVLSANSNSKNY